MQPLVEVADSDRPYTLLAQSKQRGYARLHDLVLPTSRLLRRWMWHLGISRCVNAIVGRKVQMFAVTACVSSLVWFSHADNRQIGTTLASLSSSAGLSVSKLMIEGNSQLDPGTLKTALSDFLGISMISLDVAQVRDVILENTWVKAADIKKIYPDTLVVELVERQPVALWKSENDLMLIAADGVAIDRAEVQHMHLPQVVGDGANRVASEFLTTINRFPELNSRSDAFVRVANRRWDIVLEDGVRVLLPADGWRSALLELDRMQATQRVLDRELLQIDMRLSDRLVFRLESEPAQLRRDQIGLSLKQGARKT